MVVDRSIASSVTGDSIRHILLWGPLLSQLQQKASFATSATWCADVLRGDAEVLRRLPIFRAGCQQNGRRGALADRLCAVHEVFYTRKSDSV